MAPGELLRRRGVAERPRRPGGQFRAEWFSNDLRQAQPSKSDKIVATTSRTLTLSHAKDQRKRAHRLVRTSAQADVGLTEDK